MSNITHEYEACEEEKETFQSPKEAAICVGSTGTGKSSVIKLFCGDNVIVGHGTDSQTTESKLFQSIWEGSTQYFLDSQGANDSSGTEDEKVLKDIFKKLHDEKITKIKVIWCVSGDMDREKEEFKKQAQFIQLLGNNVWNCCLIIKKKGEPNPTEIDGVLAAANRYGSNIKDDDTNRLFGYTGLEFGDAISDDPRYKLINKMCGSDSTRRHKMLKEYGFFTDEEIRKELSSKLSQLPSVQIQFDIKQCIKCAAKGDPRYVYAPCHRESEQYHPKQLVEYHSQGTKQIHPAAKAKKGIEGPKYYHKGKWDKPSFGDVMSTKHYHYYWHCCGKGKKSSWGCKSVMQIVRYEDYYPCCDGVVSSIGCQTVYICCDREINDDGCKRKYQCCKKEEGKIGCQTRCQTCQIEWGKGPGCSKAKQ